MAELEAVATVARAGGFRAAARELGVSSSALSHAIAALEDRLHVRLFNRTTRSVALTAAGEAFVAEVAPALAVINGYSAATAGLFTLDDSLANLSGDSTLITSARSLGSLSRLADQVSLQHLIEFGERLQRTAAALLDRAAFDGETVPSATVEATVHFPDAKARAAFLDQYLKLTARLVERYATTSGPAYTVGLVVHPTNEETPS